MSSLDILLSKANQGDLDAQWDLSVSYLEGTGGAQQDYQEAFKWMMKVAQSGYHPAQFNVGLFYFDGDIIEKNLTEAFKWLNLAAAQNNSEAQNTIGYIYMSEEEYMDLEEAEKWLTMSAEAGNQDAIENLEDLAEMKADESEQETDEPLTIVKADWTMVYIGLIRKDYKQREHFELGFQWSDQFDGPKRILVIQKLYLPEVSYLFSLDCDGLSDMSNASRAGDTQELVNKLNSELLTHITPSPKFVKSIIMAACYNILDDEYTFPPDALDEINDIEYIFTDNLEKPDPNLEMPEDNDYDMNDYAGGMLLKTTVFNTVPGFLLETGDHCFGEESNLLDSFSEQYLIAVKEKRSVMGALKGLFK